MQFNDTVGKGKGSCVIDRSGTDTGTGRWCIPHTAGLSVTEAETKEGAKTIVARQRGRMSGVQRETGLCFSKYHPTNSTVCLSPHPPTSLCSPSWCGQMWPHISDLICLIALEPVCPCNLLQVNPWQSLDPYGPEAITFQSKIKRDRFKGWRLLIMMQELF